VGEDGVVADLVQLGRRQLQTGGESDDYRLSVHVRLDSVEPHFDE
jgi:hypothetical protein